MMETDTQNLTAYTSPHTLTAFFLNVCLVGQFKAAVLSTYRQLLNNWISLDWSARIHHPLAATKAQSSNEDRERKHQATMHNAISEVTAHRFMFGQLGGMPHAYLSSLVWSRWRSHASSLCIVSRRSGLLVYDL